MSELVAYDDDEDNEVLDEIDAKIEQIARYVEGSGEDAQRVAIADGIRSRRFDGPPGPRHEPWVCRGKSMTGNDYDVFVIADQPPAHWVDLGNDNKMAVIVDDPVVEFAVFEWLSGPTTPDGYPAEYKLLLRGSGPSGSLRECRHIWWGERGYTYYLNFALAERVFKELRRWFDGD